ncbi:MAG: hypothetical protein IPI04_14670 [Ignavibacteria bacterium]|nr:hypothetical protein [Ignavibacteria bacterium]
MRLGYQTEYDNKGLTTGIGFKYKSINIDYAFVPYNSEFGSSNTFRWGSTSDFILSEIMSSFYLKTENFLSNEKNHVKIIIFLVVFLCAVKLPMLFTADIQPWDEGMYATRVLSIHSNGDFFDQSSHSVGRFYSGSHPPLLIWIGYASTLIFGINSAALKIVPFIFSLLCVILVILSGKRLLTLKQDLSQRLFSAAILFSIFSPKDFSLITHTHFHSALILFCLCFQ